MILIGLGANLPSVAGPPQATLEAALTTLAEAGVEVIRRSRFYRSAPVPPADQPWFVNAVVAVATMLTPEMLLALLHRIEVRFGRKRLYPNAARTLDLDLLAYDDLLRDRPEGPILPHPRLYERAFVLLPLVEVAPGWRHPRLGCTVEALIARLPQGQKIAPVLS